MLEHDLLLMQTVDHSQDSVLVLDRNHKIMYISPIAERLLNIKESAFLGKSVFTILALPKSELDLWGRYTGELPNVCIGQQNNSQKNEFIYLRYIIRPLLDHGQKTGRIITLFDITQEKKRDDAYVQAAKYSVIRQVASGLAHELRNPLTTVKGFMQLIGPEQFPERFRPYHQLILDEIQTTDKLIRNFLLLTNPTAPQFKIIEAESLIQKVIQILKPTLSMREVIIQLSVIHPISPILGDEEQLLQALLSIIQNSVENSPLHGEIKINLTGIENGLELRIQDQGNGIPSNLKSKVFDPFFTTKKDGCGLGLTIAQRIILAHHGELSILDSPQMGGTTIPLHFPALVSNIHQSA
ncbi:nitrogen regulation protein NR(II) [Desulfitobacterium sp. Sab5]|uniref:two-component system sensor histidine kinase NtrB n=1 Tax=Desulfitobacterium nosdiversum TaxID=3375356 RepID=UPI003CE877E6